MYLLEHELYRYQRADIAGPVRLASDCGDNRRSSPTRDREGKDTPRDHPGGAAATEY